MIYDVGDVRPVSLLFYQPTYMYSIDELTNLCNVKDNFGYSSTNKHMHAGIMIIYSSAFLIK